MLHSGGNYEENKKKKKKKKKTGKTTNKTEIDSRYRLLIMKINRKFYYIFVFSPHDDHRSLYGPVHFFSFSLELSIQEFDSDQLISNFHFKD